MFYRSFTLYFYCLFMFFLFCFFFNDTATTEIYTLSLHDALPISERAPIHHQLDLRVDYSWVWGPAALSAFLDVQNVYMNQSVVTYFYNYDYSQRSAFKSLPFIPSLGLRGVL